MDLIKVENPLLARLPGETLFSLCSRHHRLWGHGSSWPSTIALFGGRRLGTQHDFPAGIDAFVARTGGHYGPAGEIAKNWTLLRFYRPFTLETEIGDAVLSMRGPTVAHLKFRLGLLTSRFRANHPLKACRSCMQHDLRDHGWAYWHLPHQYPGVWVCPVHHEPLVASLLKSTGVQRFQWHLPSQQNLIEAGKALSATSEQSVKHLACLISDVIEEDQSDGWLHSSVVHSALRARLREKGWLTAAGNIRMNEAAADYLEQTKHLKAIAELQALPGDIEEARTQLGCLLRPPRSGSHPVRWLIAIAWLFNDVSTFKRQLERASIEHAQAPENLSAATGSVGVQSPDRRSRVVMMVRGGRTATSAAREVGVDVNTAMAWAAAEGLTVARRPKVLKSILMSCLMQDLRNGMDKAVASRTHGVSIQSVTRTLRTQVDLHAEWQSARRTQARQAARTAWEAARKEHEHLGVKLVRALAPAAYAWLYRNDRSWLKTHTPPPTSRAPTSGVNWDERDRALCLKVRQATLVLWEQHGKKLKLWQIYQAVADLKPKLAVLHRLPLTQRALEDALSKPGRQEHPGNQLF